MKDRRLVIKDRLFIPKDLIPKKAIKKRYHIQIFNDKVCNSCENLDDRPNDICQKCEHFIANYRLAKELENHYSVPQGDAVAVQRLLERKEIEHEIVDKRKAIPFQFDIKFTGKLFGKNAIDENGIKRVNQIKLIKKWWETKDGIIRARPRAGKTVIACFAVCRLGQKTLILADRKELINQFYRTFMGYKKKERRPMSNIPRLRRETGKEIIRRVQSPKDLQNLEDVDILLVNYQKFVRMPERIIKVIKDNFSFLVVDEVHGSGAEGYLRVVANASVKHRMGLSATPRRKDNRHRLIYRIMGQEVAKSDTASLIPEVNLFYSKVSPPTQYKTWTHAESWLSNNSGLHKELLRVLFQDLRDGHRVIIVPLNRRRHIDQMVKMINHQAKVNNEKHGEKWPKDLAIKFYDGVDRDDVLDKVDDGNPRILIAMRTMVKQGIDFLYPSKIHVYIPMSASDDRETGAPLFEQLSNRVCTPAKKKAPEITVWVHNVSFFRRTVIGLFWKEIAINKFNGTDGKYRLSKEIFEEIKALGTETKKKQQRVENFSWAG